MAASSINRDLAAPASASQSLRDRVLEYAVQKRLPYPFLSPPYDCEPAAKRTWAADMLGWLSSQTGDPDASRNSLSEACTKEWQERAGLPAAQWSNGDMEAIYRVTKGVLYYQAVHRAAGAVYLRARNIQREVPTCLEQLAWLPFHEISLEHWETLAKLDTNPQIADILNYPEGVLSMLANGFVPPLHPFWFEQGYPPASAEGQEVCPRPPAVFEVPNDTDQVFVAVPSSWMKPREGSTCTPLRESLEFLKPPHLSLELWVRLPPDEKMLVISRADACGEGPCPTQVTPNKRPRDEAPCSPVQTYCAPAPPPQTVRQGTHPHVVHQGTPPQMVHQGTHPKTVHQGNPPQMVHQGTHPQVVHQERPPPGPPVTGGPSAPPPRPPASLKKASVLRGTFSDRYGPPLYLVARPPTGPQGPQVHMGAPHPSLPPHNANAPPQPSPTGHVGDPGLPPLGNPGPSPESGGPTQPSQTGQVTP
eukprot:jgi/Botrbrau1/22477/Bobra.114_2s0007.1